MAESGNNIRNINFKGNMVSLLGSAEAIKEVGDLVESASHDPDSEVEIGFAMLVQDFHHRSEDYLPNRNKMEAVGFFNCQGYAGRGVEFMYIEDRKGSGELEGKSLREVLEWVQENVRPRKIQIVTRIIEV